MLVDDTALGNFMVLKLNERSGDLIRTINLYVLEADNNGMKLNHYFDCAVNPSIW